jgi:hypothetical protein
MSITNTNTTGPKKIQSNTHIIHMHLQDPVGAAPGESNPAAGVAPSQSNLVADGM